MTIGTRRMVTGTFAAALVLLATLGSFPSAHADPEVQEGKLEASPEVSADASEFHNLKFAADVLPTDGSPDLNALRKVVAGNMTPAAVVFGYIDQDENAVISAAELKKAYYGSGVLEYEPSSSNMPDIKELDTDGNGEVVMREFVDIMAIPEASYDKMASASGSRTGNLPAKAGGHPATQGYYKGAAYERERQDKALAAELAANPGMRVFKMDEDDLRENQLPKRYHCRACQGIALQIAKGINVSRAKLRMANDDELSDLEILETFEETCAWSQFKEYKIMTFGMDNELTGPGVLNSDENELNNPMTSQTSGEDEHVWAHRIAARCTETAGDIGEDVVYRIFRRNTNLALFQDELCNKSSSVCRPKTKRKKRKRKKKKRKPRKKKVEPVPDLDAPELPAVTGTFTHGTGPDDAVHDPDEEPHEFGSTHVEPEEGSPHIDPKDNYEDNDEL